MANTSQQLSARDAYIRDRAMIALFTDFGADDIYVGQMKAALLRHAPSGTPIIDLLHRAPNFDARAGAHLLAALQARFDRGTVFVCVVDPGVGSSRDGVVVAAERKWFVGPDNGLLAVVAARAPSVKAWRITWRPEGLSASFHGRDLFAPVASRIASGKLPLDLLEKVEGLQVQLGPADLAEVIYIDHYGNALTGLRRSVARQGTVLLVGGERLATARVFAEVPPGAPFWYENSIGLIEIASNRASAAGLLGLRVGDPVGWLQAPPGA